MNKPSGRIPDPVTLYVVSEIHAILANIFPSVNVPVLSEQIFVTCPNASKAANLRTIAFAFAILLTPRAIVTVITAGNPSGRIATATPTAYLSNIF